MKKYPDENDLDIPNLEELFGLNHTEYRTDVDLDEADTVIDLSEPDYKAKVFHAMGSTNPADLDRSSLYTQLTLSLDDVEAILTPLQGE
jgi:hypothetical protein